MPKLVAITVAAALLFAAVVAASASVPAQSPIPQGLEPFHEAQQFCQDGSLITLRVYSTNPTDPETPLYLAWSRGNLLVAVLHKQKGELFVQALHQTFPLDEARGRWATPCDVPFSLGQGT